MTKNFDPDKCSYSGYDIGFETRLSFSFISCGFCINVMVLGVDNSSSEHVDNINKDILILGKNPTDGLDDTTITAESEYSISLTETRNVFCLSLHCN